MPAYNNTPAPSCSYVSQDGCVYEDEMLVERVLDELEQHNTEDPLFYYWAMHSVHNPLQPIQAYYDNFSSIDVSQRRQLAAMVKYMDENIGKVIAKIKDKGMWNNTLIVWASDNGGPVNSLKVAATNWPLRGGKTTNWEGGIRVNAIVAGGYVPEALRGTKSEEFVTMWDWYSTFCGLAGVDPTDTSAAAYGLPAIDSYDIWPLLTRQNTTNPRTEIAIGLDNDGEPGVNVVVQGIIVPPYKLLIGEMDIAWWQGPTFPNKSTNIKQLNALPALNCTHGCLYNIMEDPGEVNDISAANQDVLQRLLARINYYQGTVFAADRGQEDPMACTYAFSNYGGFMGPWVTIDYDTSTTTTTAAIASYSSTSSGISTTGEASSASTTTTSSLAASGTTTSSAAVGTTSTTAASGTTSTSSEAGTSGTTDATTEANTSGAASLTSLLFLVSTLIAWLAV